jgi:hypothetical protein
VSRLLADPYGWIERNAARLSTVRITDDMAAVLADGQPVLPPLGIPLRLDAGRWYVALPTHLPPVSNYMPRSTDEWSIVGSFVQVLDNAVVELTREVRAGKVRDLKGVGERVQKKVVFPGMMVFAAYGNEMDVRGRRDRVVRQFRAREREWAAGREERGIPIPPALREAVERIALEEIDAAVRRRKAPKFQGMAEGEFVATLGGWMERDGLAVRLAGPLDAGAIDEQLRLWEQTRQTRRAAGRR